MTKSNKIESHRNASFENNIIDKHYNETYDEKIINENAEEALLFEKKLTHLKDNMNISLEEIELDVNILGQLVKAEELKEKKKGKIESFLFILVSLLLISFIVVTSVINPLLIKYFIGIAFLSPLAILPVTMNLLKGSDRYE